MIGILFFHNSSNREYFSMPITITDVAANFSLVCDFANKKQIAELTALVKEIKTVNFVYGLETPIEHLAYTGDDEAVKFLLTEFRGSLDYAVRGYARAYRTSGPISVEGLIRSGADINYAVTGYAIADNTTAVNDLLRRGATQNWAMKGYAQAGNETKVLALLGSNIENSKCLPDAFHGFASGNRVAALNTL
jgi:hypothetical protein